MSDSSGRLSSLPENIFGESQTRATEPEAVADAVARTSSRAATSFVTGASCNVRGDVFVVPDFTPDEEAKAKRLIPVRDALNALNAAQLKGEDTAEPRRDA